MNAPLKATIFKSNRSQAIRLPKAAAFPDHVKELTVIRDGLGLRLVPTESLWDDFFNRPGIPDWPDREPQGDWPEREPL